MNVNNLMGINARMQLRFGNNGINDEMQRRFADLMRLNNSSWQPTVPQGSPRILKESGRPFEDVKRWENFENGKRKEGFEYVKRWEDRWEKRYNSPHMLGKATYSVAESINISGRMVQGVGSIPIPEYTF